MDVVLGRGGDQAAIRQNGKYQFFGGRVEEVEKRTKEKVYDALKENVKIIPAALGEDCGLIGAACLILHDPS